MDPSVQAFLDKIDATLQANTKAQLVTQAKIDDLVAWRPDLERRIADLGEAVTALQLAQPQSSKDGEEDQAATARQPPPATPGIHIGSVAGAVTAPHGPSSHGAFNLPLGPPPPLPASGQSDAPLSPSTLSPFAHASQLLTGLGQAHPSISFPQFSGKNPNLWKTLCEQYFSMFGIHTTF